MGQDLTYRAGAAVHEYRISRADWELIQSMRERLPGEIDAVFAVPSLGEAVSVATTLLCSAADTVLSFVASNKNMLPYTYQFKREIPGHPRMAPGFTTGGMSGIRLPNDA